MERLRAMAAVVALGSLTFFAPAAGAQCCMARPPVGDGLWAPNTWTDGIVYYDLSVLTQAERGKMLDAWAVLSAATNVRFLPYTGAEPNYIAVEYSTTVGASFSAIGMIGGRQVISIWPGSPEHPSSFDRPGILLHETMHALGLWHEHQRPDRGPYIEVDLTATAPGTGFNYAVAGGASLDGPYDFASLMHYDHTGTAATQNRAIRVKPPYHRPWQLGIGRYRSADWGLSNGDLWVLHTMYPGPIQPPPRAFKLLSPANHQAVGAAWTPAFEWEEAETAAGYRLQIDDTPAFDSPLVDVQVMQTSYTHASVLSLGRAYWWRVIASNAAGTAEPFPFKSFMFFTAPVYPQTLYVDDSAPAGGDGSSWASPLRDLGLATEIAYASVASGGPGRVMEVRVGAGVYKPGHGSGDRGASFWLADECAYRGGYAGFGAPEPDARDIDLHATILSGDLNGDDLPGFVNTADNAMRVVVSMFNTPGTLLEGFTVRGGRSDEFIRPGAGGGVLVDGGSPTIRQCRFIGNQARTGGGGMFVGFNAANPLVDRCIFEGNRQEGHYPAEASGGGGLMVSNAAGRFVNCLFIGNESARWGGAALVHASGAALVNCTLVANAAAASGGGVHRGLSGGTVSNSILWSNLPGQHSGGITIRHSNVQGGAAGPGNIDQEPLFAGGAFPFTLAAGSPGIDAGDNTQVPAGVVLDLAGGARFADDPSAPNTGIGGGMGGAAVVDMGAYERGVACYANCDGSTVSPILNVDDFVCFQQKFAAGDAYANCDGSTTPPVLNVDDFVCFQQRFAAGCP